MLERKVKLVIFDLDGTLVDFPHDYLLDQAEAIIPGLAHPPVPRSELEHHFRAFDFFGFVRAAEKEIFVDQFWKAFDWANFPKPNPLNGALTALEQLTRCGIQLAIATARLTPVEELILELEPTGFLDHISLVVTREDEHVDWRDKTGHIRNICDHFGVHPTQTALVGDIPTDILSAREAGVALTIAVSSGGLNEEVLRAAAPDFLISDVSSLLAVLANFIEPQE